MEYRVFMTLPAPPGVAPDDDDLIARLFDALAAEVPQLGAGLAGDLEKGTIEIAVSLAGSIGMFHALMTAAELLKPAVQGTGVEWAPVRAEVELVRDETPAAAA
jgi:hypothetical protein